MSEHMSPRGRPVGPAAHAGLGALAFLAALALVGAASVSVQLDGWGWRALGVAFAAGAVGLFVVALRALRRGRVHQAGGPGRRA